LACLSVEQLLIRFGAAEKTLRSIETQPGFALQLLQLVASDGIPMNTRLAGALYFKNFIGRNWTVSSGWRRAAEAGY
jgi:exportin-2 (importin alpha re-exporter)